MGLFVDGRPERIPFVGFKLECLFVKRQMGEVVFVGSFKLNDLFVDRKKVKRIPFVKLEVELFLILS